MTTKFVDILFGELKPDLGGMPNPQQPGYLVDAQGVRPTHAGYRPISGLATTGGIAVPAGTIYGRLHSIEIGGTTNVFACTATTGPTNTRIYQSANSGGAWSDIEGASGAPGLWADFCQFDNFVICGGRTRVPQQKSLFASTATALADLAGSPPTGATMARVRDHVVIGNLTVGDLEKYAVQWSAINDPEDWPTPGTPDAVSKESGRQYLPIELGEITKIVGGEKFGLIFQQRGITRMTYVGGRVAYEFDTFEKKIGTGYIDRTTTEAVTIAHPVVAAGGQFYWVNPLSGVYATDGYNVRKVSAGRFDTILNAASAAYMGAAFDFQRNEILFLYAGNSSKYFIYNTLTDQFGYAVDSSFRSICESVTATTGESRILNINGSLVLQTMSTTPETVAMQTGYIEIEPGYRVQIQGAHLLGADVPGNLTLSYKTVSSYDDIDTDASGFTALTAPGRGFISTTRADAPFFSFKVSGVPAISHLYRGLRVYYERSSPQ